MIYFSAYSTMLRICIIFFIVMQSTLIQSSSISKDGSEELFRAASTGDLAIIDKLCKSGVDLFGIDPSNNTALTIATKHKHFEIARRITLEAAAQSVRTQSIFHFFFSSPLEIFINHKNSKRNTALYYAADAGEASLIELLIGLGAHIEQKDLDIAIENDHGESVGHIFRLALLYNIDSLMHDSFDSSLFMVKCNVENALYRAAKEGKVQALGAMLKEKAPLNSRHSMTRETPLYAAAQNGYSESVFLLLKAGALRNELDARGWSPLAIASENGHKECIMLLIDGANADLLVKDPGSGSCMTPLLLAIKGKHLECAQALYHYGRANATIPMRCATKSTKKNEGAEKTALMFAVETDQPEIIRMLLTQPSHVDIYAQDLSNGYNALHAATNLGHAECVTALLEGGMDPDRVSSDGSTALHIAVKKRDHVITSRLLEGKAKTDIFDKDGLTVLMHACFPSNECEQLSKEASLELSVREFDEELVRLLIYHSASLLQHNRKGETVLITTVVNNCPPLVRLLMTQATESEKHARGSDLLKYNALHVAVSKGYYESAQALLDGDIDPDSVTADGSTALHLAVKKRDYMVLCLLLLKGANPNIQDKEGWTPLMYLCTLKEQFKRSPGPSRNYGTETRIKFVQILLSHGASLLPEDQSHETALDKARAAQAYHILFLLLTSGQDFRPLQFNDQEKSLLAELFFTECFWTCRMNRGYADSANYVVQWLQQVFNGALPEEAPADKDSVNDDNSIEDSVSLLLKMVEVLSHNESLINDLTELIIYEISLSELEFKYAIKERNFADCCNMKLTQKQMKWFQNLRMIFLNDLKDGIFDHARSQLTPFFSQLKVRIIEKLQTRLKNKFGTVLRIDPQDSKDSTPSWDALDTLIEQSVFKQYTYYMSVIEEDTY